MAILTALWGLSKDRPVSHESRGQKTVVTGAERRHQRLDNRWTLAFSAVPGGSAC